MEQELLLASDKDPNTVKVLGLKVDCTITDLHIYINGVDVTKTVILQEVRIVKEKKT